MLNLGNSNISMRFIAWLLSFLLYVGSGYTQTKNIDSLKTLLTNDHVDSIRVTHLWSLAKLYQAFKPDTALQLAQQALLLAQRIKYIEGESRSLAMLALAQNLMGNYSSALSNYLLQLKIEEQRNSPRNYASALNNIGMMHIQLREYPKALAYLYQADSTIEAVGGKPKEELKFSFLINLGETYYCMLQLDSAAHYFDKALQLAKLTNTQFTLGVSMLGLANVKSLQQLYQEALQLYYQAFDFLKNENNNEFLCEASIGMAKLYNQLMVNDSAAYYGRMSFLIAKRDGFLSYQKDAAIFLNKYFKKSKNSDSAYYYLEIATALKDSLEGQNKVKESMIISSTEQLRQVDLAEQKLRDKNFRRQQLQLVFIALFIPIFFLLTLFISRSKIHVSIIKFMGIISLLLLFEYLTLLLHPFVADLTNHTPLLEIIIFVTIAAAIIPLHHKLEHLLIEKLTKAKRKPSKPNPVIEQSV